MKKKGKRFLCRLLILITGTVSVGQASASAGAADLQGVSTVVQMIPAAVDMNETDGPGSLYALSAVLMDGDSGRVLYEKEGYTARPNASTTKVMTCILALENGKGDDYVMVSKNAAAQPEVKLGLKEGEQYYLEDLLYSLMLKSHNDTAVAIAEHIGGSVEGFAHMMNEKAKEIGCENTFFITPNGLDAELETDGTQKQHSCTATDLAAIMRYCAFVSPQKETFLTITRTASRQFYSLKKAQDGTFETGTRAVSAANHNAFLQMMDGMLSGKTGFTGKAGYCYVGALTKGEKSFTIALLACGWPNNRTWKWHDARLLLEYGLEAFDQKSLQQPDLPKTLLVENGQLAKVSLNCPKKEIRMLLSRGDQTDVRVSLPGQLTAPVEKGEQVGTVSYLVNGALYEQLPVTAAFGVPKITYCYCLKRLLALVLL